MASEIVDNLFAGECNLALKTAECLDPGTISKISKRAQVSTLKEAKAKTNCETEACVVEKILPDESEKILKERFLPKGPHTASTWLSNSNIDNLLNQLEQRMGPGFKNLGFHMIDFATTNSLPNVPGIKNTLKNLKLDNISSKTAAAILNTDTYKGSGKHWFALFFDFRTPGLVTLEYFNSVKGKPLRQIAEYFASLTSETKLKTKEIYLSDVDHQSDSSSCGMYALYFVILRSHGISPYYFAKNKIESSFVNNLRKRFFIEKK